MVIINQQGTCIVETDRVYYSEDYYSEDKETIEAELDAIRKRFLRNHTRLYFAVPDECVTKEMVTSYWEEQRKQIIKKLGIKKKIFIYANRSQLVGVYDTERGKEVFQDIINCITLTPNQPNQPIQLPRE